MISQDQYLAEVFPQPPLTAFRKQQNIRDILIKAKLPVPTKPYPTRQGNGMVKCGQACTACPYIIECKEIKINNSNKWQLRRKQAEIQLCSTQVKFKFYFYFKLEF